MPPKRLSSNLYKMEEYVIDAKGETLGRVATKAATLLQAKNLPTYAPNKLGNKVVVENVKLVRITGKKTEQKIYYRHMGKPGHLKKTTYKDAFARNPEWVLKHAVSGMLPNNKLRAQRLKMLSFK